MVKMESLFHTVLSIGIISRKEFAILLLNRVTIKSAAANHKLIYIWDHLCQAAFPLRFPRHRREFCSQRFAGHFLDNGEQA